MIPVSPARLVAAARIALGHGAMVFDALRAARLEPELWPVVAKGAGRYLEAIASGDVAPKLVAAERMFACDACDARRVAPAPGGTRPWDWCGVPLLPLGDEIDASALGYQLLRSEWDGLGLESVVGPTCGCLLALKCQVASESCPRGRWTAVTRDGACMRVAVEAEAIVARRVFDEPSKPDQGRVGEGAGGDP